MLGLLLLSLTSCQKKLSELYQNPDGFSKAQADQTKGVSVIAGFFTAQLTTGYFLMGDYGTVYHQIRSGSRITGSGNDIYYTCPDAGYAYLPLRDVEHDWGTSGFNESIFNFVNAPWVVQYLWAQRQFKQAAPASRTTLDSLYMNLLTVLKDYGYQRATDMYDMIPYVQSGTAGALDGLNPQYMGQKDLYPVILAEFKSADAYLAGLTLSSSQQSAFGLQDILFGGSITQWRKFINSERLRCALTVSVANPTLTQQVLTDLKAESTLLFSAFNDVAGIADITTIAPYRICDELGITRSFRERGSEFHVPQEFLDAMNVVPTISTKTIAGITYSYVSGDNTATGLANGTVDPRIAYMYAPSYDGLYVGKGAKWDDGTNPNSRFNMALRGHYINDPVMSDLTVTSFTYGAPNSTHRYTLVIPVASRSSFADRDAFLLKALRAAVANGDDDGGGNMGSENSLLSEYNVRPLFNFAMRFPTMHAVETELELAEAAVRGLGAVNGTAQQHYQNAISLSCQYWYDLNNSNAYSKSTLPAIPSTFDDSRLNTKPNLYNADAYAAYAASQFAGMSQQQQLQAIYTQLIMHYNYTNFEVPYTTARRMIALMNGKNPAPEYEIFKWKERLTYPSSIQAADPANWAIISVNNNPDIPLWFTGRTTKYKNAPAEQ